jgi:hypothetical protein
MVPSSSHHYYSSTANRASVDSIEFAVSNSSVAASDCDSSSVASSFDFDLDLLPIAPDCEVPSLELPLPDLDCYNKRRYSGDVCCIQQVRNSQKNQYQQILSNGPNMTFLFQINFFFPNSV